MAVPEEIRRRLTRWCADRIPERERDHRQVGYSITGDDVVVSERRAPRFPELGSEWTNTPLARLKRSDDGTGWTLYRPAGDRWQPTGRGEDPIDLLDGETPALT